MYKFISVKYLVIYLVFIISGCGQKQNVVNNYVSPKCISSQSQCEIKTNNARYWILFNVDTVITENPFEITVKSDSKFKVINIAGYMEGKDMFMGKIPLFFNKTLDKSTNKNDFISDTLLGSCTDEKMRWVVKVDASLEKPDKTIIHEKFSIEFSSQRFN